jgi:hypothetical protein
MSSGEGRGAFFDAPPAVAEPVYTTQHRLYPRTRPQAGAAATRSSCTSRRMVVAEVHHADLEPRPRYPDGAHDLTAHRVFLMAEHMLDTGTHP